MAEKKKTKKAKKTRAITGRREYDLAIPSYQGAHTGTAWTTQGDKAGTPPLQGNGWQANGRNSKFYDRYFSKNYLLYIINFIAFNLIHQRLM